MTDNEKSLLSQSKCLVVITGASRGFGRALSIAMANTVGNSSNFLLTALSAKDLEDTANMIKNVHKELTVNFTAMDMGKPDPVEYSNFLKSTSSTEFDVAILVHNAGSLGSQGTKVRHMSDPAELVNYYSINLVSAITLNSIFMNSINSKKKYVVNISSLCAVEPFPTFGQYCSVKAARDMFFGVLAKEEEEEMVRVLSYAPGPMETDMYREIVEGPNTDAEMRKQFLGMRPAEEVGGRLLKPEVSAAKLVSILCKDKFENGKHVDYFDDE